MYEFGCKAVIGERRKQSGMFWHVDGAQNVLSIRCVVNDGNNEMSHNDNVHVLHPDHCVRDSMLFRKY